MKVVQINAVYGHGSTGTIVLDIERMCYKNDIECLVASPDPAVHNAKKGYQIGNCIDHKIHAILCRINGRQAYFSKRATYNFLKYLDEQKPDIVHLHNLHSNYINLNILLDYLAKKDILTIVTLHDCWFYTGGCFHYANAGCYKWLNSCGNCPKKKLDTPAYLSDYSEKILFDRKKYLLSIPRLIVTGVSDWITNEARKTFLKDVKTVVIRNGIDLNIYKPTDSNLRKLLGLENKYIILGPSSKWLDKVNKDVLRQFTSMMREDEILLLYGATNTKSEVPANVLLYGYTKDRRELAQLYTMADCFVNCSREDSLSLINVEAQACGTPVITFDATGPKETVDEVNSFSVKVGNGLELYEKLKQIRYNIKTDKNSLLDFVNSNFEINNNYQLYIDLYRSNYNKFGYDN